MNIEFLQKNHADANDLDHKVTLNGGIISL